MALLVSKEQHFYSHFSRIVCWNILLPHHPAHTIGLFNPHPSFFYPLVVFPPPPAEGLIDVSPSSSQNTHHHRQRHERTSQPATPFLVWRRCILHRHRCIASIRSNQSTIANDPQQTNIGMESVPTHTHVQDNVDYFTHRRCPCVVQRTIGEFAATRHLLDNPLWIVRQVQIRRCR